MNIGLYVTSSKGCLLIHELLKKEHDVTLIDKDAVEENQLTYDTLVFPGGYDHLFRALLSSRFRANIKEYVESGGNFIGICGGSLLAGWLRLGNCKLGYLRLLPYYIYYALLNKQGKTQIAWDYDNVFDATGIQPMTWVAGPYILELGTLNSQAKYAEDKLFLPLNGKPAIALGKVGEGKTVLFCPHPEYLCDTVDNSQLILKALEWIKL